MTISQLRGATRPAGTLQATGTVHSLNPRRFCFCVLDEPLEVAPPDPAGEPELVSDVFVPPPLSADILAGDRLALVATAGRDGRLAAARVEVIARRRFLLAGTLSRSGRGVWFVDPDPTVAAKGTIVPSRLVPPGAVDGAGVIVVLDPTSLGRPEVISMAAGPFALTDPAWAEAVGFVDGYGQLPEAPGPADDLVAWAVSVLRSTTRPPVLPKPLSDPPGLVRTDLRDLPTFTIDGPSTKDIDDAVSAAFLTPDAGNDRSGRKAPVRVWVHIADAARLVPATSPLDRAAFAQGTSVYQTTRTLPMLPRALSEDAGSLRPGQDRPTLTVSFEVAPDGSVAGVEVCASLSHSDARLTYQEVQEACYATKSPQRPQGMERSVWSGLSAAVEAARRLGASRDQRSTLTLGMGDPRLVPEVVPGGVEVVEAARYPEAETLIERLMVAANEAVASWLLSRQVPALYRVHGGLDTEALIRAAAVLDAAGLERPETDGATEWSSALEASGDHADTLSAVLATGMVRAGYVTDPGHHFGLDSQPYLHFTSPLRRYADLVVHRVLRATLSTEPAPYTPEALDAIGAWLDERMGASARAERSEDRRLWAIALREDPAIDVGPAEVAWVSRAAIGVRFVDAGLVAKAPAPRHESYEVDEHRISAKRPGIEVRLGQGIDALVADVDLLSGRIEAVIKAPSSR